MATLMEEDLSALPFLNKALHMNTDRFPSAQNGLTGIQQLILELLRVEEMTVMPLFQKVSEVVSEYGLGDLQFWGILDSVRQCESPLVSLFGGNVLPTYGEELPPQFENWIVRITEIGILVHECELDHISLNDIDDWIAAFICLGRRVFGAETL